MDVNPENIMKKVLLGLFFLFLFAGAAQGASLKVGDKTIAYDVPDNFVSADHENYTVVKSLMKQNMPQGITIHALYVDKEVDAKFRESQENFLDVYMMIATNDALRNHSMNTTEFKQLKTELLKTNGKTLSENEMVEAVRQRTHKLTNGALSVGAMEPLGCYAESDTAISMLALLNQTLNLPGKAPEAIQQGMVMTFLMVDGKLLMIYQYKIINDPKEITPFKEKAQKVITSMNFKEGAGESSPVSSGTTTVSNGGTSGNGGARGLGRLVGRGMFGGVIVGAIIGGVVVFLKRRNRKEP